MAFSKGGFPTIIQRKNNVKVKGLKFNKKETT